MKVEERILLKDHTMFKIGGAAELFITVESADELSLAFALAREHNLPVYALGEGSNVLVADSAILKAIVHLATTSITYEEQEDLTLVHADGGVSWDALVTETTSRGLWGLENLAGIPGTVGAAPVQNVGAYGREVKDTLISLEAYDPEQNVLITLSNQECAFGYRDSRFKQNPGLYITSVTFRLSRTPSPEISYPDLQASIQQGIVLDTPEAIAEEVRTIRARKFPDLREFGTAGSFFKNPRVTLEKYAELSAQYLGMPGHETETGIKIPLAWILDHVLSLRGYSLGPVSLFQKQPLVLVAGVGATAHDVNELAVVVENKVFDATGIRIEREVQFLS